MKNTRHFLSFAAGLLILSGQPLPAQMPTGPTINANDKQYLMHNAQDSTVEYASAETAVQKASSSTVQQYASQLMQDHTQFSRQILMLAHDRGIVLPVIPGDAQIKQINMLIGLSGTSFDRTFLRNEVQINAQEVAYAKQELNIVSDPEIKDFATQFEQTEQAHLVRAEALLRDPNAPEIGASPAALPTPVAVPGPSSVPNTPLSVPATPSPGPNVPTPAPNPTPVHGSKS